MFSWFIHTTYDANRFTLVVPIHYMAVLVCSPALVGIHASLLQSGWKLKLFVFCAVLFIISLFCHSATLTLDRTTGKATIREFDFLFLVDPHL